MEAALDPCRQGAFDLDRPNGAVVVLDHEVDVGARVVLPTWRGPIKATAA
jgi:hypothetical protein